MIMQLQYLSKESFENLGGLYVQASEISNVESVLKTRLNGGKEPNLNRVLITLKNGKEYLIPWGMSEFLDEWCKSLGLHS